MASNSSIAPHLVIIEGKDKGKVIPLKDGTAVLGRSKGDVLVQDPRISRSHVAVHFDGRSGRLTFTDLKSLNGTMVNGEAVEAGELHDGDKLQLGNTLFDIQLSPPTDAAAPSGHASAETEKKPILPLNEPLNHGVDPEEEAFAEADLAPPLAAESRPHREFPQLRISLPPLPSIAQLQQRYLRLPRRIRIYALSGLIVLFAFTYLGRSNGNADRDIAAARQLAAEGKVEEATSQAAAIQKKFPGNVESYLLLGELYANQQKNSEAIDAYQKAHELKPAKGVVHVRLVRLYLKTGMQKEAEEEAKHIEELIKQHAADKDFFVEAFQLFFDLHQNERAQILAKALETEIAPESSVGFKLEAQLMQQQNHGKEALQALEKGLALDPDDDWLLENTFIARLTLKDADGGVRLLKEWIQRKPKATYPRLALGYLNFNEKNYEKALPFVQQVIDLGTKDNTDSHYPEALQLMGQLREATNQPSEAVSYYRQACQLGFQQSCAMPLLKNAPPATTAPTMVAPATGAPASETAPAPTAEAPTSANPDPDVDPNRPPLN